MARLTLLLQAAYHMNDILYHYIEPPFDIQRYDYLFIPALAGSGPVPQDPQSNFFNAKTMPHLLFAEVFHNELITVNRDALRFKHNLVFA